MSQSLSQRDELVRDPCRILPAKGRAHSPVHYSGDDGRTGYQEKIATLNGVSIPLVAFPHLTGRNMPTPAARPAIWWDPVTDAQASRTNGSTAISPGKVVDALLLADPRPAVAHALAADRAHLKAAFG